MDYHQETTFVLELNSKTPHLFHNISRDLITYSDSQTRINSGVNNY